MNIRETLSVVFFSLIALFWVVFLISLATVFPLFGYFLLGLSALLLWKAENSKIRNQILGRLRTAPKRVGLALAFIATALLMTSNLREARYDQDEIRMAAAVLAIASFLFFVFDSTLKPLLKWLFTADEGGHITAIKTSNTIARADLFLQIAETLLTFQMKLKYQSPDMAFGDITTNKEAAGYIFGFHDALLQHLGVRTKNNTNTECRQLLATSYQQIFGKEAGDVLFYEALIAQPYPAFQKGRESGASDLSSYLESKTPPLQLTILLGIPTT